MDGFHSLWAAQFTIGGKCTIILSGDLFSKDILEEERLNGICSVFNSKNVLVSTHLFQP